MWDIFLETAKLLGIPVALVMVAVIALYTGQVVPKKTVDKLLNMKDEHYKYMQLEKDRQIRDAKTGEAEMWAIVKPTITILAQQQASTPRVS